MKWFQHQTDSHDDEFLKELLHKYKARGLGVWWTTLEHVAKIVKVSPAPGTKEGYTVSAKLEIAPSVLIEATGEPLVTLVEILSFCAKRGKFSLKRTKQLWVLEWPKILEYKDNATADLIGKYRRELGSALGSDLDVTSGLHTVIPMGIGNNGGIKGGGEGEGSADEDRLFAFQVARQLCKFIHSPSNLSITKALQDLIRQGVSKRLIAEAPMMPEYQTMDFYDITRDLKKRSGGQDGGSSSHSQGSQPRSNAGAKAVVGHFGLKPGELDEKTQRRIEERERRETEAQGGGAPQDRGDGGAAPKGDAVPGSEKV